MQGCVRPYLQVSGRCVDVDAQAHLGSLGPAGRNSLHSSDSNTISPLLKEGRGSSSEVIISGLLLATPLQTQESELSGQETL